MSFKTVWNQFPEVQMFCIKHFKAVLLQICGINWCVGDVPLFLGSVAVIRLVLKMIHKDSKTSEFFWAKSVHEVTLCLLRRRWPSHGAWRGRSWCSNVLKVTYFMIHGCSVFLKIHQLNWVKIYGMRQNTTESVLATLYYGMLCLFWFII